MEHDELSSRTTVVVELSTFRYIGREYSHWGIQDCKVKTMRWVRDDSFELADGTERTRTVVVIS